MQTSPLATWVRRPAAGGPGRSLAGPRGFEPRFTDPKSAVLPLDEGPAVVEGRSEGRNGAEDGTRTRDPHLGKVMLYQLSHFRSIARPAVPGPFFGAESQDRTGDTAIFSRVLYQLSYLGPVSPRGATPPAADRLAQGARSSRATGARMWRPHRRLSATGRRRRQALHPPILAADPASPGSRQPHCAARPAPAAPSRVGGARHRTSCRHEAAWAQVGCVRRPATQRPTQRTWSRGARRPGGGALRACRTRPARGMSHAASPGRTLERAPRTATVHLTCDCGARAVPAAGAVLIAPGSIEIRGQSRPCSCRSAEASSGDSPVSWRRRLIRSAMGGCVEKSPCARDSNFLIGFTM